MVRGTVAKGRKRKLHSAKMNTSIQNLKNQIGTIAHLSLKYDSNDLKAL